MSIQEEQQNSQMYSWYTVIENAALIVLWYQWNIFHYMELKYGWYSPIVLFFHHSKCIIAKLIHDYTRRIPEIADQFVQNSDSKSSNDEFCGTNVYFTTHQIVIWITLIYCYVYSSFKVFYCQVNWCLYKNKNQKNCRSISVIQCF